MGERDFFPANNEHAFTEYTAQQLGHIGAAEIAFPPASAAPSSKIRRRPVTANDIIDRTMHDQASFIDNLHQRQGEQ